MIKEIPLSKIDFGKNVRHDDDDEILSLAKSINEHDLIQPLVVTEKNGRYEIICGHRRFKAMKLVFGNNLPVPCIVRNGMSDEEMIKIQVSENIHRKNMSAYELVSVFEEIQASSEKRLTHEELGRMFNRNKKWVENQYDSIKALKKMYGEEEGLRKAIEERLTTGTVVGMIQREQRKRTEFKADKITAYVKGKTLNIVCANEDKLNEMIHLVKEHCGVAV